MDSCWVCRRRNHNAYRKLLKEWERNARILNDNGPADLNFGKKIKYRWNLHDNVCEKELTGCKLSVWKWCFQRSCWINNKQRIWMEMNISLSMVFDKNTIDRVKLLISEIRLDMWHLILNGSSKLNYKKCRLKVFEKHYH